MRACFVQESGHEHQSGEFREGQTRELVLKDVTVDAFDVILRSAYHLEPNLTPQKALHALKAAKLWMIEDLERFLVGGDWNIFYCSICWE